MKKLALLLVVCVAFVFSANAQETPKVPTVDYTGAEWNKHDHPHVVADGSSYDYAVKENVTKTLAQLIAKEAGNPNRYFWEVLKVNVDETVTPWTYTLIDAERTFTDFSGVQTHVKNQKWDKSVGDYFLIRVSEFANHQGESDETDLKTKKVSEILVKIGDILNIHMDAATTNSYLCSVDETPAKMVEKFDTDFGATKFEFNGRPMDDGTFKVVLNVKTYKGSENPIVDEEVRISVAAADLIYTAATGYYTTDIKLDAIAKATVATSLDTDATDNDIYHVVTVLGYVNGDTDTTATPNYTAVVGTGNGEKAVRTYGIYTTPKISKINHK